MVLLPYIVFSLAPEFPFPKIVPLPYILTIHFSIYISIHSQLTFTSHFKLPYNSHSFSFFFNSTGCLLPFFSHFSCSQNIPLFFIFQVAFSINTDFFYSHRLFSPLKKIFLIHSFSLSVFPFFKKHYPIYFFLSFYSFT